MAKSNSRRMNKLRRYRDKLIGNNVNLNGKLREYENTLALIRKAMQKEDHLRAYALASNDGLDEDAKSLAFSDKNELTKELSLVYKILVVERRYTDDIHKAAGQRDYLRVAALCADHKAESQAHEKMLTDWSVDHGFTRRLRKEMRDEDVA